MRWNYRNCIILYAVYQVCPYTIVYTVEYFALQFILKPLYSFVSFGFSKCVQFVSYVVEFLYKKKGMTLLRIAEYNGV